MVIDATVFEGPKEMKVMLSVAVALLNPRKQLEKTINAKGQVPFKKN